MNTPKDPQIPGTSVPEIPLNMNTSDQVDVGSKAVDSLLLTKDSTLHDVFDLDKVYPAYEFLHLMLAFQKAKGSDLTMSGLIHLLGFNKVTKHSNIHFATPPVSIEKPVPRVSIILDDGLYRAFMNYEGNRV